MTSTIEPPTEPVPAIGGVPPDVLAERYGTPLYVYDADAIRAAYSRIQAAVPYRPHRIHYACVANANLALMRLIGSLGGGIHANTWGDVLMALHAGFCADDIMYSGGQLGPEDMFNLFSHGIAANVSSLSQLRSYSAGLRAFEERTGERADACRLVGLRLHLEDEKPFSRMGVKISEIDEALAIGASENIEIAGVHYYRGTGTLTTQHFLRPFETVIDVARRFADTLRYVDVGGGFGFQYRDGRTAQFDWDACGEAFTAMLEQLTSELGRSVLLIFEPGRSVVASAGFLLTRVLAVDRRAAGGQIAGVDTTTSHVSKETYRVYGGYRRIALVGRSTDERAVMTDVVGCTTFSDDYIGRAARHGQQPERGLLLPPLREGDLLAVLDTGAYGFAFASNFLNRPRPAEVIVDRGEVRLVRRRETYDDMMRLQTG